jgi:FkbM family methyltransferase
VTIHEADGLKWWMVGDDQDPLVTDRHETELLPHLDDGQHHDGAFVDVGAHRGKYSVRLAPHWDKVYAIEPDPDQRAILMHNLDLNDCHNVTVIPFAAWGYEAQLALVKRPGTNAVEPMNEGGIHGYPLDRFLENVMVGLVKIDTEGAEVQVLRGMGQTIANWRPKLVIEMHHKMLDMPSIAADVSALLTIHGYEWDMVYENANVEYWVTKGD